MDKEKIKKFWEKNKKKIIVGTAVVAGLVIAYKFGKKSSAKDVCDKILDAAKETGDAFAESCKAIDKDIFTELAPEIEEAILEEGLDEYLIEKTYEVAYPLGGVAKNGFYKAVKKVRVMINDIE